MHHFRRLTLLSANFLVSALLLGNVHFTRAFIFAPGSCSAGKAVTNPHAESSNGSLEEGGYEFVVDGTILGSSSSFNMKLEPLTTYSWEIRNKRSLSGVEVEGPEMSFRGFLARFGNVDEVDISDALSIDQLSEPHAKIFDQSTFPMCPIGSVAVGHVSNEEKDTIKGELYFDQELGEITLDLTIVAANTNGENRWYFSDYRFEVSMPTTSPAPSPDVGVSTSSPSSTIVEQTAFQDGSCVHEVKVRSNLFLNYQLNEDANSKKFITAELTYEGQAWVSLGIPLRGQPIMVTSQAIIGLSSDTDIDIDEEPKIYSMTSIDQSGVNPLADEFQTLFDHSFRQTETSSILTFSKYLDEPGHNSIKTETDGGTLFLYAIGFTNRFLVHKDRGAFKVDLNKECAVAVVAEEGFGAANSDIEEAITVESDTSNAWRIHGILAGLAWAVATPLAILSSMFRSLWKEGATWLKVHLYLNLISLILTIASVIVAVMVFVQTGRPHFTHPHHLIGIVVLILAFVQIISGFLRPPAGSTSSPPSKKRIGWQFAHKFMGILTFILSIFQIFSGIWLNKKLYMAWNWSPVFGAWLAILVCLVGVLKFRKEPKTIDV